MYSAEKRTSNYPTQVCTHTIRTITRRQKCHCFTSPAVVDNKHLNECANPLSWWRWSGIFNSSDMDTWKQHTEKTETSKRPSPHSRKKRVRTRASTGIVWIEWSSSLLAGECFVFEWCISLLSLSVRSDGSDHKRRERCNVYLLSFASLSVVSLLRCCWLMFGVSWTLLCLVWQTDSFVRWSFAIHLSERELWVEE